MFKKLLSRKFLTIIGVTITDILIATGVINPPVKVLSMQLVTAIGSLYVLIEGIADIFSRIKNAYND